MDLGGEEQQRILFQMKAHLSLPHCTRLVRAVCPAGKGHQHRLRTWKACGTVCVQCSPFHHQCVLVNEQPTPMDPADISVGDLVEVTGRQCDVLGTRRM